jgi:hypothetical protein
MDVLVRRVFDCTIMGVCRCCHRQVTGNLAVNFSEFRDEPGVEVFIVVDDEVHLIALVQIRCIPRVTAVPIGF